MSDLIAMAKYARVWTLTDITGMRLISEKRDESPFQISDRALARAIDVSAPRVSNFSIAGMGRLLRVSLQRCAKSSISIQLQG